MSAQELHDSIANCILDHFEFCTDHKSSANCAAAEITASVLKGKVWVEPIDSIMKEWILRYAELLECEPRLSSIAVQIGELQEQLASAKKMIATLRHRKESE